MRICVDETVLCYTVQQRVRDRDECPRKTNCSSPARCAQGEHLPIHRLGEVAYNLGGIGFVSYGTLEG